MSGISEQGKSKICRLQLVAEIPDMLLHFTRKTAFLLVKMHKVYVSLKTDKMKNIKHIVYLMLENRSLDNVLGWLYEKQPPQHFIYPEGKYPAQIPPYQGLQKDTYFNLDANGQKHFVQRGTTDDKNNHELNRFWVPYQDPYEEYQHVNNQIFENETTPVSPKTATMGGFYKDFAQGESFYPWQIMETYVPEDLTVLNGAAANWAVSDEYFSSVPTQTNCNRAFALTGNSIAWDEQGNTKAWVNNNMHLTDVAIVFNQKTMFNVLEDAGKDWMVFASEPWFLSKGWSFTRDMLFQVYGSEFDKNFGSIEDFFNQAKGTNGMSLPAVSFLEPKWGLALDAPLGLQGTDYHPPMNVLPGEQFVADVLNALQASPDWNETLLIINFDEHGGTYDHVPPSWGASPPWENASDGTPTPDSCEDNFKFDRFGVRVPLILVSPYIDQNTVFRSGGPIPYDHTSVIATILTMMDIPRENWNLGTRVAKAPTFEHLLSRDTPRTDKTMYALTQEMKETIKAGAAIELPPNDLQRNITIRALNQHAQSTKNNTFSGEDKNKLLHAATNSAYQNVLTQVLTKLGLPSKSNFAEHLEGKRGTSGPWYQLQLFQNGSPTGWLGQDEKGYCIIVRDQSLALSLRDYPYHGTLYLQTEDEYYLSVSSGDHYVGKYGWAGARGWVFESNETESLLSLYNNQPLSLYSVANGYLYCNKNYKTLSVKRAYV